MDKLLESTSTADSKEMTPKHKLQSLNLLHNTQLLYNLYSAVLCSP